MADSLSVKNILSIIKFQRKYRSLKNEISVINEKKGFYGEILLSMVNNLIICNKSNIYRGTDSLYIKCLEELKDIKLELDKIPKDLSIKSLKNTNLNNCSISLINANKLILKYINHVSPENITFILKLLFNEDWIGKFSDEDMEKILFMSNMFVPICVWYSEEHKNEIKHKKINITKKSNKEVITKDILESLFGGGDKNITSIIIGKKENNGMPKLIRSITDLLDKKKNGSSKDRKNNFKKVECVAKMEKNKLIVTKNPYSMSLIEDKFGACLYLSINKKIIVIQGYFKDDLLNISKNIDFIQKKYKEIKGKLKYDLLLVPSSFKNKYINILSLRDILVYTSSEIGDEIKKKYNDFKSLQGKPLISSVNEFILASKYRKIDILTLLLLSKPEDRRLAYILYDVLKAKDKTGLSLEIYSSLHYSIRQLLTEAEEDFDNDAEQLSKMVESDIPYEKRIGMLNAEEDIKCKAMEKLKSVQSSFQGDSKAQAWLDGLLKIPFGIYKENPILSFKQNFSKKLEEIYTGEELKSEFQIDQFLKEFDDENALKMEWNKYQKDKVEYINKSSEALDKAVHGHREAKTQIKRIIAQWINGESTGAVFGLEGPPGTGKTSLAKNGIAKCLEDENGVPRPFAFLAIGGSVNGSTLVGHNYTYVGSTWGRIVDLLITHKCMNPIIFIDEIDKVSRTEHGREIISILTHLTDSTQNDEFEDKYFGGIKFNLSKALIIFSFNDISLLDPILRDRITVINTKPLTLPEKIVIIKKYMLPEILETVGYNDKEIILDEEIITYIIQTYTIEAGVRKVKEKIFDIVRDINLKRVFNEISLPYKVEKDYVEDLFAGKPKIRVKKTAPEPSIGLVNGLYATTAGVGGLTVIQVLKYPSEKMLDLTTTGKQGDVMKESVNYAFKIAYRLLPEEIKNKILEDANNKKSFGLHIHTPEAATPKDGPSAGAAMTLAIYSVLMNKKVNNKVALTGEIDLCGNVTAIGGVGAKTTGAKRAGVILALIPKENLEDLEILRREGLSPEDDNFKIETIENIQQVFDKCLV